MPERTVKEFESEAAHFLPSHQGKWHRLHGQNFLMKVGVYGELTDGGMFVDFYDLKTIVNEVIIDKLDHKCLNPSEKIGFFCSYYERFSVSLPYGRIGGSMDSC